ncbi:nucleoredoxin-like [Planococcus citri]|uniref:nucleoredoxin-like n=1 Tax=Planococcus citri TaxID=170843 RepID=UPI0031F83AFC
MGTNLNSQWFKRFGNFLTKFDQSTRTLIKYPIETGFKHEIENEITNGCTRSKKTIGLYIVPISEDNLKYLNQDVTDDLKQLYVKMNESCGEEHDKYFQVVQICYTLKLPNANSSANEDLKHEYENVITNVPWFALPYDNIDKCIRTRHRYGVKDGEFALILLDASSGELITRHGHDRLLEDSAGLQFPWAPTHVLQILENIPSYISCNQNEFELSNEGKKTELRTFRSFRDIDRKSILGIYFSAHWCPPCKAFTSQLIKTYKAVREKGHKFEVILVSSDRSSDSYNHYISTMPWLAIPYDDTASRQQLTTLYGIQGIPSLVLLNPDGSVITEDGRGEINDDPQGTNFPWYQKSVNILTPRLAAKLQKNPAVVLFIDGEEDGEIELATAVLAPISECVKKKYQESLLFFIANDTDTSESLREFLQLEDVSPLLTLIDIPLGRLAVMEYGKEITERTIMNFVNRFYNSELSFLPIERPL